MSGAASNSTHRNPIVEVSHVSVAYRSLVAVEDVSFVVERGDYFCVVGGNGSGKSSLIKAMLGIVPLASGRVSFGISNASVGYVPQASGISRDFPASVYEVVLSGREGLVGSRRLRCASDREAVCATMAELEIQDLRDRLVAELSGGQLQRVLLARAICRAPELLILDEPCAGLDESSSGKLLSNLADWNGCRGLTIVMVTHDMSEVRGYANRVAVMNRALKFCGPVCDWRGPRARGPQ